MRSTPFTLTLPPSDEIRQLTTGWLLLALASLVLAGLFTLLIVLSRTPFFQEIIPWVDFFHTALVVHVDLTVLVWFLAFAGVLWSYNSTARCVLCGKVSLLLATMRHADYYRLAFYRRRQSADEQLCSGVTEHGVFRRPAHVRRRLLPADAAQCYRISSHRVLSSVAKPHCVSVYTLPCSPR